MEQMDYKALIQSLDRFGRVLPALVGEVSEAQARWKPSDGAWSILEIVTHLADEETEDFRQRLKLTLADPTAEWPAIDPEGWAVQRRYNEGVLSEVVDRFVRERRASVAWLRGLCAVDWSVAHPHPKFKPISAGDLLTSWAAHDLLHLRQITKRMYQLACDAGGEYASRYAGEW